MICEICEEREAKIKGLCYECEEEMRHVCQTPDKWDTRQDLFEKMATIGPIVWFVMVFYLLLIMATCSHAEINMDVIKQIESLGNPYAVSVKGCRGLYQISAITLKEWNNFHPLNTYTPDDLFDANTNQEIADWYLHERIPQMLRHFKLPTNTEYVLIAYNAGIKHAIDYSRGKALFKETENYIRKYKGMSR